MKSDKSNKGILDGMLGGMIVSLTNSIFRNEMYDSEIEEIDKDTLKMMFKSFSEEAGRKIQGYKLKHDIDEPKIKEKFINLIEIYDSVYEIKLDNKKNKNNLNKFNTHLIWDYIEDDISSVFKINLYNGFNIFNDKEDIYLVYCINEDLNFRKIIISTPDKSVLYSSDTSYSNSKTIVDRYICLDIEEARELAQEMKRYYHKEIDRVLISEEIGDCILNKTKRKENKTLKDLNEIKTQALDLINEINSAKYIKIKQLLNVYNPLNSIYLFYSLYSLAIQLYKDDYNNQALIILKKLLNINEELLEKLYLKRSINEDILNVYISLRAEKYIINLIKVVYKDNYNFLNNLAKRLYSLKLYKSANVAYDIVIENEDQFSNSDDIFEAYIRTQNDKGLRNFREKLLKDGNNTWFIDRYLRDEDPEGLKIKSDNFWEQKDWKTVIYYSNKYTDLVLKSPWRAVNESIDYQFKKIEAYMELEDYKGAWNSSCKIRAMLISNFEEIDSFYYLYSAECYMTDIALEKGYFTDAIFHYISALIYCDMYIFYHSNKERELIWKGDRFLQQMLEENMPKIKSKIYLFIRDEYARHSEKAIRTINSIIINLLDKNHFELKMLNPNKYFPTIVPRDFNVE